jgi:hypothetical protein
VRPGSDMAADPIQGGQITAHQLQHLGGVGAVWTVAFDIHLPPQLIGGRPPQPRPHEAALQSEHDAAQEADPLSRWNVSADLVCGFAGTIDESS